MDLILQFKYYKVYRDLQMIFYTFITNNIIVLAVVQDDVPQIYLQMRRAIVCTCTRYS